MVSGILPHLKHIETPDVSRVLQSPLGSIQVVEMAGLCLVGARDLGMPVLARKMVPCTSQEPSLITLHTHNRPLQFCRLQKVDVLGIWGGEQRAAAAADDHQSSRGAHPCSLPVRRLYPPVRLPTSPSSLKNPLWFPPQGGRCPGQDSRESGEGGAAGRPEGGGPASRTCRCRKPSRGPQPARPRARASAWPRG